VALIGCGRGAPEFYQLKGNVTFDGKPVVYGAIEFLPDAAKGQLGPSRSADIVDGAYDTTTAGGNGLSKGPHIARVTIFSEKLPPTTPEVTAAATGPTAITIGFPLEVNVAGPTLDLDVPASARGFDMYNPGR
jgi:hypothetical protein